MRVFAACLLFSSLVATAYAGPAESLSPTAAITALAQPAGGAPPTGQPMLEITKKCPQLRYLGRDATFEITVTNRGNGAATGVVVTDAVAGGTEFLSADNGGNREGNNITWRLGALEGGQSVTLKASFRCAQIGPVRNTATVTYCAQAVAECNFEVKGIPAILLECVDNPDPIEVGGTVTYTITVTNQGTQTGTNIRVECTLPPEQEFVKAGGATTASAEGKAVKFAPLPSLAPKAAATFTVSAKGIKAADSRFKVSMKSDQTDSPVEETESTHIYE